MDGANAADGGDGDSAKPSSSGSTHQPFQVEDAGADHVDAERAHVESAKRCKMCVEALLDAFCEDVASPANGSSSTSEQCEAGTSSGDNSMQEAKSKSAANANNVNENGREARPSWDGRFFTDFDSLDSDDDPDPGPETTPADNTVDGVLSAILLPNNAELMQEEGRQSSTSNEDDDDDDDEEEDDDSFFDNPMSFANFGEGECDVHVGEKPPVLQKARPKPNWFIIPEMLKRQFGTSANRQASVQFQQRCYGSLHCVERLELMYKLEKHTGCVNSINFHPNGKWLASGSDDLNIVVWDWKLGNPLLSFESKHKSNVFQSKFLPLNGDDMHIVSCARDGQVRLAQVSAQEGFRSTRKLGTHKGPCHKLTILADQPQVVISVGEDGFVMRHDLRKPKSEKLHIVQPSHYEIVALYSISSNPLNSNEYCVAGRDYRVRTYDVRKSNNELAVYHPFETVGDTQKHLHVTCAMYNHNGSEILASYSDEDIYLFDVNGKKGTYVHSYQGHRNGATIKGVNFFGPKSEFVISGSDCGHVFFWEKDSEAIVQFLLADDNGVVNCLEPHPQLPFLCTSGLDTDIKVWVPSYEEDPKLADLAHTVQMNLAERSHWSSASSSEVENARILWMLWRQFNTAERSLRETIQPGTPSLDLEDAISISSLAASHSTTSTSSSSSSSSEFTTSASDDSDAHLDEGPDGCATS